MNWNKIQKIAFKSILKNKMRSALTSLGIIIGVSSVIVMVAIGQGSQSQIEEQINSLGTNLLIVFPGSSSQGGIHRGPGSFNKMKLSDCDDISDESQYSKYISPSVKSGAQVIGGSGNWNTEIEGVSESFLDIKEWNISEGEFFTEKDVKSKKKVAILGKTVANALFENSDPIGQKIRIRNIPFTVKGILEEKGQTSMGNDQDDIILAPSTTVLSRLKGKDRINMIYISVNSMENIEYAKEEIQSILRQSHKIDYGEEDDFTIRSQTEITEMASETSRTMTLLLGAIAGVSLLVGGIGIMNIMLVSVTERTKEIGIRLSIGARSKDVLTQFLAEAVTLSLIGGFVGIILSISISIFLNNFTEINTLINFKIVLLALLFSAIVGIFFGYYPARKAAELNPIDALRYE